MIWKCFKEEINTFLSVMCTFTFEDCSSADSSIYSKFLKWLEQREITVEIAMILH
jgi:hypothetical protein